MAAVQHRGRAQTSLRSNGAQARVRAGREGFSGFASSPSRRRIRAPKTISPVGSSSTQSRTSGSVVSRSRLSGRAHTATSASRRTMARAHRQPEAPSVGCAVRVPVDGPGVASGGAERRSRPRQLARGSACRAVHRSTVRRHPPRLPYGRPLRRSRPREASSAPRGENPAPATTVICCSTVLADAMRECGLTMSRPSPTACTSPRPRHRGHPAPGCSMSADSRRKRTST